MALLCVTQLSAQNNPVKTISITFPVNPGSNTSEWGSGSSVFTVTATGIMVNGKLDERLEKSRMLISVKKGLLLSISMHLNMDSAVFG